MMATASRYERHDRPVGQALPDNDGAVQGVLRQAQPDLRATQLFVALVEIEKNLAHVAAMAGMASGHVGGHDSGRHFAT